MKLENGKITLRDDARIGVEEEVRSGFLDWLFSCSVTGDDGEEYALGGSILSMNLEGIDLVTMNITHGKGYVEQLRQSIYKVCRFPGYDKDAPIRFFRNPKGTLHVEQRKDSVLVTCGKEYQVECFTDNSWHIIADSGDGLRIDFWHRPQGEPLWYGREKPSLLTQHSVTYGYNWAGSVEGEIVFKGKTVKVKGAGIRERYVAVDSSAAELGGWEDWGFVHFNEMSCSLYDMRLGMKDFAINDHITGKSYGSDGTLKGGDRDRSVMDITHEDWAFSRDLDGFIPSIYNIRIKTEDGTLQMRAKVVNAPTWGVTFQVPDNPVATLTYDEVTGTFTDNSGNVRTLTGGRGIMSVRQWHAYPNILPRELYADDQQAAGVKFDTL